MVYRLQKSQPQVVLVAHSRAFYPSILLCRLIVGATGVRSLSMQTREHLLLGRSLQLHVRPKKFNYSRLHMTSYPDC